MQLLGFFLLYDVTCVNEKQKEEKEEERTYYLFIHLFIDIMFDYCLKLCNWRRRFHFNSDFISKGDE
jgi:hypothetical protein